MCFGGGDFAREDVFWIFALGFLHAKYAFEAVFIFTIDAVIHWWVALCLAESHLNLAAFALPFSEKPSCHLVATARISTTNTLTTVDRK